MGYWGCWEQWRRLTRVPGIALRWAWGLLGAVEGTLRPLDTPEIPPGAPRPGRRGGHWGHPEGVGYSGPHLTRVVALLRRCPPHNASSSLRRLLIGRAACRAQRTERARTRRAGRPRPLLLSSFSPPLTSDVNRSSQSALGCALHGSAPAANRKRRGGLLVCIIIEGRGQPRKGGGGAPVAPGKLGRGGGPGPGGVYGGEPVGGQRWDPGTPGGWVGTAEGVSVRGVGAGARAGTLWVGGGWGFRGGLEELERLKVGGAGWGGDGIWGWGSAMSPRGRLLRVGWSLAGEGGAPARERGMAGRGRGGGAAELPPWSCCSTSPPPRLRSGPPSGVGASSGSVLQGC